MLKHQNPELKLSPVYAALLVALAAPLPLTTHAQEEQTDESNTGAEDRITVYGKESKDYVSETSTIGGKLPVDIRDIPQTITIINQALLESQAATTLTEALRNAPGITLSAGEGGNIGDNINLRGFSARTDLFIDGARDRGQYTRETFFLESVEVLRGPSSMLFGRGSTGGVINQVTKQAGLKDYDDLGVSGGSDAYARFTLDSNHKLSETSALRVAALTHDSESTRDIAKSERAGVSSSLRFGIGTETGFAVSAVMQEREDIPDYGVPVAGGGTVENPARPVATDKENFYGYTDDIFEQEMNILGFRVEHKFSDSLSIRNQTQRNAVTIHAMPTRVNTNPDATLFGRDRRERDIEDESVYNQTDLISRIETGSVKHTIAVGIEFGRDYYTNQGYVWNNPSATGVDETTQSIENPVYGPMPAFVVRDRTTFTDNESETQAIYVNDQMDLGHQWQLVLGVRSDNFDFSSKVTNSVTGAVTTDVGRKDSMTSSRAGLIYQPGDIQSYYVSYGTSFNPSAETLTLSAANTSLDPEENRSIEIGTKLDFGKVIFNAAAFDVEKSNARSIDPLTGLTQLDGTIQVRGLEIGANGRITETWQIMAGYTNLDGEIVDLIESGNAVRDGNVYPNTPEHTASLWTAVELGNWEVGGGAVYSSERFLNNANTAITDGYTRYDATVSYEYDQYQFRLNLQNLSDEEYYEVASGGRATPATGSQGIMTVNVRF